MPTETYARNLNLFNEDLAQRRILMRAMPIWLGLVLTTRCNLRCIMCGRVRKSGDLPSSIMDKVRPFYPYLSQMQWQGGEVFVVDYFREMFEEATRHPNIFHMIITAGSLIDAAWARRFAQSNVTLMFSIDSAVPENYRVIRKGTGRRVVRSLNAAIMRENAEDVPHLIPFALKYRLLEVDVTPRVPLDDDVSIYNPAKLAENRGRLLRLREDLVGAGREAKRVGIRLLDRVSPIINGLLETPRPAVGPAAPGARELSKDWDCFVPWRGLLVQAEYNNGDIMPDCNCFTTVVGNVNRDDLVEVWNNEAMQEYRRRIVEKRPHGWCNPQCTSAGMNPAEWFKPELNFVKDRLADPREPDLSRRPG
jgi:MoaA/NifB/PqqE/SkfB family radical SAM enzyme